MMVDTSLSALEAKHRTIQTESPAGYYTPMRTCTGQCKRRRSIGQFAAGSTVCMRCERRAP